MASSAPFTVVQGEFQHAQIFPDRERFHPACSSNEQKKNPQINGVLFFQEVFKQQDDLGQQEKWTNILF